MAFPDITVKGVYDNVFGFYKTILSILQNGIGADRPKTYLGAQTITTAGAAAVAATIPDGTTIVRLVVSTDDDAHIRINGTATTAYPKYFKGQEYWLAGGALTNLTSLSVIRPAGTDVNVYAEYYKQG